MPRLRFKRFKVTEPPPGVLAHYLRVYTNKDLHFNPHALAPLSAESLFGNSRPMVFDLGCGRGEFLLDQAAQHPDNNFVGFDVHWKSLWYAINKTNAAGLDNIRFVRADLRITLFKVPDQTAEQVYMLFPPPVMKHSKRKKDLLTTATIAHIDRLLIKGGLFHFVTDSPDYFDHKHAAIRDAGTFSWMTTSRDLEGGITRFQQLWESLGIESYRLLCRK
ncbi:MAG: methyltransferase domain-containing protein [Anaerolineae bacterium]|nr:methyltransferase domain-containing protein [Anaerolineae bacterium]